MGIEEIASGDSFFEFTQWDIPGKKTKRGSLSENILY